MHVIFEGLIFLRVWSGTQVAMRARKVRCLEINLSISKLECIPPPWHMNIDSNQFININVIYHNLGSELSDFFIQLHAIAGSDRNTPGIFCNSNGYFIMHRCVKNQPCFNFFMVSYWEELNHSHSNSPSIFATIADHWDLKKEITFISLEVIELTNCITYFLLSGLLKKLPSLYHYVSFDQHSLYELLRLIICCKNQRIIFA